MRNTFVLALMIAAALSGLVVVKGQDPATQQPTAEELAKQKEELEKNAYRLLDQVIDEAQSLRLTENRVRIQINAADLLWERDQGRARSLFSLAADGVAEMMQSNPTSGNQRGFPPQDRRTFSLRQELVLSAARHDAQLAYQLLAATKSQTPVQNQSNDQRNVRQLLNLDENLEQTLLGRVAALDPQLAAQNAEQMMDKGQFPRSMGDVINQLQRQDPEAASKLADKTVKRIQTANLLSNNEAGTLAQALINVGPRLPVNSDATKNIDNKAQPSTARGPVLEPSAYTDLLSTVIDAALKATPQSQTQGSPRAVRRGQIVTRGAVQIQNLQPTDAQIEQNNARRYLTVLQMALPSIDQYLPGRANAVRQKLTEMGMGDSARSNIMQTMNALQRENVDAEALVKAAATAPPQLQPRIYQQAAVKALDEGNTDRARQIANDHLQAGARDFVMQRIDFKEMAKKSEAARLDEIRQSLARLSSENDKVTLLLQIASDLQKDNPKAQLQVLEEARQIVNHRAANYEQFDNQLKVAHAFVEVDPARSFEVLESGISQLNELLSAASVLSGFEVNIFRDGEMSMINQGGGRLNGTISHYGDELAQLSKTDFERSETLAGRFQFAEPRILARLSIVQGALGLKSNPESGVNIFRNFGGGNFVRRPDRQ